MLEIERLCPTTSDLCESCPITSHHVRSVWCVPSRPIRSDLRPIRCPITSDHVLPRPISSYDCPIYDIKHFESDQHARPVSYHVRPRSITSDQLSLTVRKLPFVLKRYLRSKLPVILNARKQIAWTRGNHGDLFDCLVSLIHGICCVRTRFAVICCTHHKKMLCQTPTKTY